MGLSSPSDETVFQYLEGKSSKTNPIAKTKKAVPDTFSSKRQQILLGYFDCVKKLKAGDIRVLMCFQHTNLNFLCK